MCCLLYTSQLAGYIGPISTAMWVFPFVALLFTVPYVISSYRRYGAVLFFRALVVYSFIFYMMCEMCIRDRERRTQGL